MIELCSPSSFARDGFGPLVSLGPAKIRDMIRGAGLGCISSHFRFTELKEQLDDRIAFAKELGLTQMICATLEVPPDAPMSSWQKAFDQMNEIGAKTRKAGIQLGYHNHQFEFREIDGVLVYDELMKRFDPELIKMQFQDAIPPQYDPLLPISRNIPGGLFLSISRTGRRSGKRFRSERAPSTGRSISLPPRQGASRTTSWKWTGT